jgi:hypothetical protein
MEGNFGFSIDCMVYFLLLLCVEGMEKKMSSICEWKKKNKKREKEEK